MKTWVFTANVKCNPWMSPRKVKKCYEIIHNTFGNHCLGGLQEINRVPWYYRKLMRKILGTDKLQYNTRVEVPLIAGRKWVFCGGKAELAHKGRAGASPNRYVSHGLFRLGDYTVALIDCHFISGAWNNKRKSFKKWRQQMWQINWDLARSVALEYVSQGYPIIFVGDVNRLKMDKFHPDQIWLVNHGIDKIAAIPSASIGIKDLNRGIIVDTPSDHPLRGAEVEFYLK